MPALDEFLILLLQALSVYNIVMTSLFTALFVITQIFLHMLHYLPTLLWEFVYNNFLANITAQFTFQCCLVHLLFLFSCPRLCV